MSESTAGLMYMRRAESRASRCGLGGGACCAACAVGKTCMSSQTSCNLPGDGCGPTQEDVDAVAKQGSCLGPKTEEEAAQLQETLRVGIDAGVGDAQAQPPRPVPMQPEGGRWVLDAQIPADALQILHRASHVKPGGSFPPGSIWQQAMYRGTWYGLYTPPRGHAGSGEALPPRGYVYVINVMMPGGLSGAPVGLGDSAQQIQQALNNAAAAAAAKTLVTDDYSDAIGYCQAAAQASYNADSTLTSHPSLSTIGTQMGGIQKLQSDGNTNAAAYAYAYQYATTAYQAFLKDSALPANNVSPTPNPSPAPSPTPPGPSPTPPAPAPAPPATSSSDYSKPILWTAGAVAAVIVGTALYKRYGGKLPKLGASSSSARTRRMSSARTRRVSLARA